MRNNANQRLSHSFLKNKALITLGITLSLIVSVLPANARRTWQNNPAPIAKAGTNQTVTAGTLVTLNGSQSYDPDGQPITYNWTWSSIPANSSATLSNATTATPSFTPDVAGSYVVSLKVSDANATSSASLVTVTANAPGTTSSPPGIKVPIYGVTLDDLSNMNGIIQSLSKLPYKPTVRVVFDKGTSAATYYPLLVQLH